MPLAERPRFPSTIRLARFRCWCAMTVQRLCARPRSSSRAGDGTTTRATGCSRAQGPSGASPARSSARQTPGATPIIRHLAHPDLADCIHMFWPCETRTSTCRSFATISSGLYRFLAIAVLNVKDIPQVGPLNGGGSPSPSALTMSEQPNVRRMSDWWDLMLLRPDTPSAKPSSILALEQHADCVT